MFPASLISWGNQGGGLTGNAAVIAEIERLL